MKIPRFDSAWVLLALMIFALPLSAQEKSAPDGKHLGTWKLVSTKYGDATEFTKRGEESLRLKLITATHFTWLEVDNSSKKVVASAGGKYTMAGTTYTETIDFAGDGMEAFLGKPQKFTVKIEGDKLTQAGELSNGLKIEEIWERMK